MAHLLNGMEPAHLALLLPAFLVLSAWTLQMACSIASIDPPDFWQSLFCVILLAAGNVLLRVWLDAAYPQQGLGLRFLAPLALSVAVIAVTVRIGPLSALVVTVCEGLLCAGMVIGLETVGNTLGQIY